MTYMEAYFQSQACRREEKVELKIDFVTENTTRRMNSGQKCHFIISKLKADRVVVFEGGLDESILK